MPGSGTGTPAVAGVAAVAPAAYPVTLAEAKLWCKCYTTDGSEDGLLTMLIAAMVNHAEHLTGRAFVERTLVRNLESFGSPIELPWPPLIAVDSISYTDINGNAQTVDGATYEVDTVSEPGNVRPVSGASWPSIGRGFNPVRIVYRAGYAAPLVGSPPAADLTDNSYLPAQLRLWIQARIVTLYDQRGQIVTGTIVEAIPRAYADGLLDSLVVGSRLF